MNLRRNPVVHEAMGIKAPPLPPPFRKPAPTQHAGHRHTQLAALRGRPSRWSRWMHWLVWRQPSWLTSLLAHLLLLMILGLLLLPIPFRPQAITLEFGEPDVADVTLDTLQLEAQEPAGAAPEVPPLQLTDTLDPEPVALPEIALPTVPTVAQADVVASEAGADVQGVTATGTPGGFDGRQGRRGMAESLGATAASEEAVDRALVWIAAHQLSDGTWNFDLHGRCDGRCANAGVAASAVNGATALSLLPFLGAGQTHEQGYHHAVVERGLRALMARQAKDGSFLEMQGTMYSHGLATLVLCESLGMTKTDPGEKRYQRQTKLHGAAQRAVDFIVQSQHPAGGWRYAPRQAGDTSVVGWQAMALQSAKMAGLRVPKRTLTEIDAFLNSVQGDDYGAQYGYAARGSRPGTSAIGLLCRMYGGWDRNSAGIIAGADYLHEQGPSSNNVYYNYYATQVLHHYQGPYWTEWHPLLRDHLVDTQSRTGHESGSWYFSGDFGSTVGGRLYITAMSTMVLEVYYRHMPIYKAEALVKSDNWRKQP